MNNLVPCPNCGEPYCADCGTHYGSVGSPASGTVGGGYTTIEGGTPISTATMAYGVYLNQFKLQYEGLLKYLQDRYNLKRSYAGLPKQPVQFDYALIHPGAGGAGYTPFKISGAAALFLKNRLSGKGGAFSKDIMGRGFLGGSPSTFGSYKAKSNALPLPDAGAPQQTAKRYEGIASLAGTDQGGDNPFSVELPDAVYDSPFKMIVHHHDETAVADETFNYSQDQAMEASYRKCIYSIADVLGARITSLNQTHVELLGLIDEQIKRDKYAGMTVSTGLKGFTPVVNANTPAAATPLQFNPYSTSVGTRSTRRR